MTQTRVSRLRSSAYALRVGRRHAKSFPDFDPAQGLPLRGCLLFAFRCPRGAVRNDWAKCRARGARICMRAPVCLFRNRPTGSRTPLRRRQTGRAQPVSRPCPPRKQYSPAFRTRWILRLATCPRVCRYCRRSPFVRTVARTCTWTVRPCYRRVCSIRFQECVIPVGVRSPASWRTTASRCHATNTLAARPLTERDVDKIFLLGIKSKIKFAAVKQCQDSQENASAFKALAAHR